MSSDPQIAFTSIAVALRHYLADLRAGRFHIHHGVIAKVGAPPLLLHPGLQHAEHSRQASDLSGVS